MRYTEINQKSADKAKAAIQELEESEPKIVQGWSEEGEWFDIMKGDEKISRHYSDKAAAAKIRRLRQQKTNEDKETLHPPSIDVGDEVKVGKFRNSKAIVKGFKKDDHNQPVLKTNKGDKKLFSLRLSKLQQEDAPPGREKQVKALKGKVDNPYAVAWASYNKSKNK